jgi:seryl-tRNA synthetase
MQGVHRRRFVQDGEVPVTVVRRDTPDSAHPGVSQTGPTSSRLQRVEAALAAETTARERLEKALHEAQATVQALQTKIGHNELAKNEAVLQSKRHLEEMDSLKEQIAADAERVREAEARAHEAEEELRILRAELVEDRRARKLAERLLREATEETVAVAAPDIAPAREPVERPAARRGRPPSVRAEPEVEPEPVKWWLLPTKGAAKRR